MRCPTCQAENPANKRFCADCGGALDGSAMPTVALHERRAPSSSTADEGRFPAGTMLGERYKIIGLLGRGGMGEVYRAADLKLEQQVALKFLPPQNARLIERFRAEVRIARQVSHRNVCRVYDLGEIDGAPFISMEYVDGEDLGSLLRRIGRLPGDKALEFARRLCAGLAAAHEKGVLHRDLKPANIMIDGRGQVLIMDFGLAAAADAIAGGDIRSGTPAYMAPEQKEGREVTVRSDIYSLGLVLQEMFLGRESTSSPKDLDPAVEKVIQRCLDPNPSKRPQTALDVARGLPGGDPLAEALAAGDTPSPEMVAASEDTGALSVRGAIACLALLIAGIVAIVFWEGRGGMVSITPMPYSADNLELKAREMIAGLGYTPPPADVFRHFTADNDYVTWAQRNLKREDYLERQKRGEPPALVFDYVQSPEALDTSGSVSGISADDPARVPGTVDLRLDPQGRLRWLRALPIKESATAGAVDWSKLFGAAGLEMPKWTATDPQEIPPVAFDARGAWTGTYPSLPGTPLRIEAAAWKGRPVWFKIFGPWSPERSVSAALAEFARVPLGLLVMLCITTGVALLFAIRNLRTGRGDLNGAVRLGLFVSLADFTNSLLSAHHLTGVPEIALLSVRLGLSLFLAAIAWALYMAAEPYVRRRWPQSLIGWTRALQGNFRDPVVAGHILVGLAAGTVLSSVFWAEATTQTGGGAIVQIPWLDVRSLIASWFGGLTVPPMFAVGGFFFFLLLRLVLRRTWLAAGAILAVMAAGNIFSQGTVTPVVVLLGIIGMGLYLAVGMRFGILALAVMMTTVGDYGRATITSDFSAWYAPLGALQVGLVLLAAGWSFRNALGGRKVWKGDFLES